MVKYCEEDRGYRFMLYNIVGAIFIILAIGGGIYTLNNRNDMPFSVVGLKKEKYQVIDNEKFNSIMLTQSIFVLIWVLLTGALCMFIKETVILALPSWGIFIMIIFSEKAKKCIKSSPVEL